MRVACFRSWEELVSNIHLVYTEEDVGGVVKIVKKYVPKIWKVGEEEAFKMLQSMANELTEYYGINPIEVRRALTPFRSYYVCQTCRIMYLTKPSLYSFLHEFKHILNNDKLGWLFVDPETDANAFAASVFYLVAPKTFMKSWREGKIKALPPDLCPERENGSEPEVV